MINDYELVECELVFVKVKGMGDKRIEVFWVFEVFCVCVIDMILELFVFELIGVLLKLDVFVELMCLLGLVDVLCIGVVVIVCGVEGVLKE